MRKLLIVGLGNPEKKYEKTRHNIGFEIARNFINTHKETFSLKKNLTTSDTIKDEKKNLRGSFYDGTFDNIRIGVLFPLTFMNNSGISVKKAIEALGISAEEVLVIHDDKDMRFGKLRLVPSDKESSSGGHNGVASLIERLGTSHFSRLKFGVANSQLDMGVDTADFVLLSFTPEEKEKLPALIDQATQHIDSYLA